MTSKTIASANHPCNIIVNTYIYGWLRLTCAHLPLKSNQTAYIVFYMYDYTKKQPIFNCTIMYALGRIFPTDGKRFVKYFAATFRPLIIRFRVRLL